MWRGETSIQRHDFLAETSKPLLESSPVQMDDQSTEEIQPAENIRLAESRKETVLGVAALLVRPSGHQSNNRREEGEEGEVLWQARLLQNTHVWKRG